MADRVLLLPNPEMMSFTKLLADKENSLHLSFYRAENGVGLDILALLSLLRQYSPKNRTEIIKIKH
jgi:hypothetical protein